VESWLKFKKKEGEFRFRLVGKKKEKKRVKDLAYPMSVHLLLFVHV
jgi:hypothetical protein